MPAATRVSDKATGPFIGRYTGTTAAQNIYIGFKPAYIRAWNFTDGDTEWVWSKNDVANLLVITTAAANGAIAVAGVEDATGIGFSLPSNAVVNEDAKVYHFIAFPE